MHTGLRALTAAWSSHLSHDLSRLTALGWNGLLETAFADATRDGRRGLVVRVDGRVVTVLTVAGQQRVPLAATLSGAPDDGGILNQHANALLSLGRPQEALAELFADPGVAFVHARAVEFGCFTFEIRRPDQIAAASSTS